MTICADQQMSKFRIASEPPDGNSLMAVFSLMRRVEDIASSRGTVSARKEIR